MLNELEVVYWSLVNELVQLSLVSLDSFLKRLMMTALFAKKLTNPEIEVRIYEAFLSHNYPKFINEYYHWWD